MSRRKNNYNPEEIINITIICPNCSMGIPHTYIAKDYDTIWCQCSFCLTRIKWTKCNTSVVIPANQLQYHVQCKQQ